MYKILKKKNPEDCDHEDKKDFSFFDHMAIKQPHFYCPDCRSHWFKNKEWTAEEWEDYINVPDEWEPDEY